MEETEQPDTRHRMRDCFRGTEMPEQTEQEQQTQKTRQIGAQVQRQEETEVQEQIGEITSRLYPEFLLSNKTFLDNAHKKYYKKIEGVMKFRHRKNDYNNIKKKMFLAG